MRNRLLTAISSAMLAICAVVSTAPRAWCDAGQTAETIVIIRHGEKIQPDLGQLRIRGLNRALALPDALSRKGFGHPDFIFAPDPHLQQSNGYDYVRALATIEPTAIKLGMPVNTTYAFGDYKGLAKELEDSKYDGKTIIVAWEHVNGQLLAAKILADDKSAETVRTWGYDDYDSMYIVTINRATGASPVASILYNHEGLDNMSDDYPTIAPPNK